MRNHTRFIKSKGENKMKKLIGLMFLAVSIMMATSEAYAANRFGSVRVGGLNSHGLGSTYVGGWSRY